MFYPWRIIIWIIMKFKHCNDNIVNCPMGSLCIKIVTIFLSKSVKLFFLDWKWPPPPIWQFKNLFTSWTKRKNVYFQVPWNPLLYINGACQSCAIRAVDLGKNVLNCIFQLHLYQLGEHCWLNNQHNKNLTNIYQIYLEYIDKDLPIRIFLVPKYEILGSEMYYFERSINYI